MLETRSALHNLYCGLKACTVSVLCIMTSIASPAQTFLPLHGFDGTDGSLSAAGLVAGIDGNLYGTTQFGGASTFGTVFMLSVGLDPFVETLPSSGNVGTAIKILGTDLTGATSVSFKGTPAVFKVVPGGSEITTKVPCGATPYSPSGDNKRNAFEQRTLPGGEQER